MKKWSTFLYILLLFFGVIGVANADIISNGGFEDGLAGWTYSPNVNVQETDVSGVITPVEGDNMAVLATWLGAGDACLQQDFNLDGYLDFTLSFSYNLQALDISLRDRGTDSLNGIISGNIGSHVLFSTPINDGLDLSPTVLGWQSYSNTFDLTQYQGPLGPVTLSFKLVNWEEGDTGQLAAAYIDAVSVTGTSSPVPEPATMVLFGSGLIALVGLKRTYK